MKHRPNTRSILLPRGGPVGVSWHLDLDLTTFNFTPVFRNKNLVCRCRRLRRYSNILQPLRRFLVLQVGRDGIVPFDLNTSKSSPATPPFRPFSDRKYSRAHLWVGLLLNWWSDGVEYLDTCQIAERTVLISGDGLLITYKWMKLDLNRYYHQPADCV